MRSLAFFAIAVALTSCGPDLDAEKYTIGSVQWQDLEDYTFNYDKGELRSISVTDGTSIQYQYFTDSTQVKFVTAGGTTIRLTTLVFSGARTLTKLRTRWRYNGQFYKDSISFNHNGSRLQSITWKGVNYLVTFTGENITNIRRNFESLGKLDLSYDKVANPFKGVYWVDEFINVNQSGVPSIQLNSIARFFSVNNITLSDGAILSTKFKEKYTYDYLYGILPKSVNKDEELNKTATNGLIYIALIVYNKKPSNTTP
jgi:hypothetical protein